MNPTDGRAAATDLAGQPRFGPPYTDVRIERGGAQRIFRAEMAGLVRIDLDPHAAAPGTAIGGSEVELTFGTAIGTDPVDQDFLFNEVERISGYPVLAIRRRERREQAQRRVLILEAPPGDRPIEAIYAAEVEQGDGSLILDADEVFVFRGDEATCNKHPDVSIVREDAMIAVAIQRRP